jgi:hypothetical protein
MTREEQARIQERRKRGPLRLLVEGPDDKHTIISLVSRHDIDWDSAAFDLPFVEDAGGVEKLLRGLTTAVSAAYDRLGVVVDMDDPDGSDRWAQVRDRLREKGVAAPDAPAPEGTIVPADDPCFSHAESATTQARKLGAPLAEKDHLKGAIRAWLAWRAQPGVPFGTALTSKYLRHDSEEALRFLAWFKKLFLEPAEAPEGAATQRGIQ